MNAQRDSGDINVSFEPKKKAHASTQLPFGFEGRIIFHLEPEQNAEMVSGGALPVAPLRAGCKHGGS